ncbi:WYL domain-containing protein [Levilactobacillus zymae]|uniref:helix-turn-helix transcriptional regulator n=1 Tax=Levilactobacillus zymae TaxID=267363 RepID=UPI0028B4C90C|nr:WYL domain-containing protein [Levilactobacillus zymae]MDT6981468.1 WYL domain-containing protein [Levilactobacillus zymae]
MNSQERIVNLLFRLLDGEHLNFRGEAHDYGCSERTLTRDQAVLADALAHETDFQLAYDSTARQHYLDRDDQLLPAEVLALIQLALGTRVLSHRELRRVTRHLLGTVSQDAQKTLKKALTGDLAAYTPVGPGQEILPALAKFSDYIAARQTIRFTYQSQAAESQPESRVGRPLSLYFSETYFYVVMALDQTTQQVLRLDRFISTRLAGHQFQAPFRVPVAELTVNRQGGTTPLHYRVRYWGHPQNALDKLPSATVTQRHDDGSVTIEGDRFSREARRWLLGQGNLVQVLAPQTLVADVKATLQKTLTFYA